MSPVRLKKLSRLAAERRNSGLSEVQSDILLDLALNHHSQSSAIAGRIGANPATMRRYLSVLRKQGYLIRRVNDGNVMNVDFSLSGKGVEYIDTICKAVG